MKWETKTIEDFTLATTELLQIISDRYTQQGTDAGCVVCLHGDLGAGKTTMTQIIAGQLGVADSIQSPTFVIKKMYSTRSELFKQLIHMDAYRLDGEENLDVLRLDEDFMNPNTLTIIEWPEMIEKIIPKTIVTIRIEYAGKRRVIELK